MPNATVRANARISPRRREATLAPVAFLRAMVIVAGHFADRDGALSEDDRMEAGKEALLRGAYRLVQQAEARLAAASRREQPAAKKSLIMALETFDEIDAFPATMKIH